MKQVIDISAEVREGIRKTFKVTDVAIWYALGYDEKRGQSDTAKRIRQYAKKNGGVTITVAEKSDTVIFDSDGSFHQYFSTGATIDISKRTGDATISWKGEPVLIFENIKVRQVERLQSLANMWSDELIKDFKDANKREPLKMLYKGFVNSEQ
jgi:hypothetical protein